MAAIRRKDDGLVLLSGDQLMVLSEGSEQLIQIPNAPKEEKDQKEKNIGENVTNVAPKNCVLASAISLSGKYLAVGDDQKQLHLYGTSTPEWTLISSRSVARRCTAMTFTHSEKEVVVADRTGDVYRFCVEDPELPGQLVLGHLSMVIDLVMTRSDQYLVTCDRDEKVRISHYPNGYNIHTFCLLHTEYVNQVIYVDQFNCLVSGSGDGSIVTWDLDGNKQDCVRQEGQGERSCGQGQVTLGGGESERQEQAGVKEESVGVKRIVYDDALCLLAVLYNRSRLVSFYTLLNTENQTKLQREPDLTLTEEPWDICFDKCHHLLVLQPCEQKPVAVYAVSTFTRNYVTEVQVAALSDECSYPLRPALESLSSCWDFFKASLDQTSTYSLQKLRTYDNMQKYLERKEERISGKKNKEGSEVPPEGTEPPPEKKLKSC